jgi:hypothetical protein
MRVNVSRHPYQGGGASIELHGQNLSVHDAVKDPSQQTCKKRQTWKIEMEEIINVGLCIAPTQPYSKKEMKIK